MSGKKHRQKGDRIEREIVQAHLTMGVHARRVPSSGSYGGEFSGDILIDVVSNPFGTWTLRGEVKARANGEGFKVLEQWLGSNDLLVLRRNTAKPLVVLSWQTWQRLLVRAQDVSELDRVRAEAKS